MTLMYGVSYVGGDNPAVMKAAKVGAYEGLQASGAATCMPEHCRMLDALGAAAALCGAARCPAAGCDRRLRPPVEGLHRCPAGLTDNAAATSQAVLKKVLFCTLDSGACSCGGGSATCLFDLP